MRKVTLKKISVFWLCFSKSPRQMFKIDFSDPYTRSTMSKSVRLGQGMSLSIKHSQVWGLEGHRKKLHNVMASQSQISQ